MKILALASSPSKVSNSEILLDKVIAGASSYGSKIKKIRIADLKIEPCRAERECHKNGICCIQDDMVFLYEQLDAADVLLVAAPLFFGSVPAQLKAVIDRCQSIWVREFILKGARPIPKRKGIFICTSANKNSSFFNNFKQIIEIWFMVLGVKMVNTLYVPNLEKGPDILGFPHILDKAYNMGLEIAK